MTDHLEKDECDAFTYWKGPSCLLLRLKRLVNDDAVFASKLMLKTSCVLNLHISVVYYLHIFTNVNDHITHIYISF